MTTLETHRPAMSSNVDNILFTIKKTNDGFSFEGIEGTAWKTLSSTYSKSICHQKIDQNGITMLE